MDCNLEAIGALLRERGLKLATAESCTGGLVASRITDIPGASDYFVGGVVAYANPAKVSLLGVSEGTLEAHGAVSRETVLEMARGARERLGADVGVSVSGIAGPDGGLPGKPVGTVWIAVSVAGREWARRFYFQGGRLENKAAAVEAALQLVCDYLEGKV